jgi:hypothetical protein
MSALRDSGNGHQSNELDVARREVARAERQFSHRLSEVSAAGEATMKRAVSLAKPVLVGVAVVGGVVWLASLLRRGSRGRAPGPSQPSILREALRSAALSLAAAAARRVGEHFLAANGAPPLVSPGRSVPASASATAR